MSGGQGRLNSHKEVALSIKDLLPGSESLMGTSSRAPSLLPPPSAPRRYMASLLFNKLQWLALPDQRFVPRLSAAASSEGTIPTASTTRALARQADRLSCSAVNGYWSTLRRGRSDDGEPGS